MNRNSKNIVVSGIYWPFRGNINIFKDHLRVTMSKNTLSNKSVFVKSDFNIISLDYSLNELLIEFFDISFENSFAPIINLPTRVTRNIATCTDHNHFLIPTQSVVFFIAILVTIFLFLWYKNNFKSEFR